MRANHRNERDSQAGMGTQSGHGSFQHAGSQTAPAGMDGGDRETIVAAREHWNTIRSYDPHGGSDPRASNCVGLGGNGRTCAHDRHLGAVNLTGSDHPRWRSASPLAELMRYAKRFEQGRPNSERCH